MTNNYVGTKNVLQLRTRNNLLLVCQQGTYNSLVTTTKFIPIQEKLKFF